MDEQLVVLDGSTFFVSDAAGDIDCRNGEGFFFADTRHLSGWQLLVNGAPLHRLTSRSVDYYSARIFGTLADARVGVNPTLSVRRDRIVADGVHEDVVVENHSEARCRVNVELRFEADFADLFEVKDQLAKQGAKRVEVSEDSVTLRYEHGSFQRGTRLVFSRPGSFGERTARFEFELDARSRWALCIDVCCIAEGREHGPRTGHGGFGALRPQMPLTLKEWLDDAPRLESDQPGVVATYRQSLLDLAALRFRPFAAMDWSLPAAGLPWFMALFGRDSLITAYMALPFQPRLAAATLDALAALQATEDDPFRDAEPGKILHELRCGELATLGEVPHSPYFGAHDSTPLFLILLDEYERWTGDTGRVRRLEGAARAALAWIEGPGDRDGDGYLEYQTRSPKGLANQCWKDSWNSVLFADGRLAEPPIATCEIQGYAYEARVRTARLAREVWGDAGLAVRLEADAAALRQQFHRDFWCEERGHYALALDAAKQRVDALTSNTGHLLWSGIVPEERAPAVVSRLLGPELHSGWGIRTMSTANSGYNPLEYHNGTVWPHDTAIVAEGLRHYGFRDGASALAFGIFEAAEAFASRLPEVFAGFSREESVIAVEYPTASRPQAWSAAAPLLALRTLLGLDVVDGEIRHEAHLAPSCGRIALRAISCRGQRRDAT